jgi:hypothetical protein
MGSKLAKLDISAANTTVEAATNVDTSLLPGLSGGISPDISLLPAEMLERIFRHLPPSSLKVVVLVCRRWREVGEAPGLWTWVVLRVTRETLSSMPEVLDSRRLAAVRRICVEEASEELLEAVARHQGLRTAYLPSTVLTLVKPNLLAKALSKIEEVFVTCGRTPGSSRSPAHHPLKQFTSDGRSHWRCNFPPQGSCLAGIGGGHARHLGVQVGAFMSSSLGLCCRSGGAQRT